MSATERDVRTVAPAVEVAADLRWRRGLRARAVTPADFPRIAQLQNGVRAEEGEPQTRSAERLASEWDEPGCDLARDAIVVVRESNDRIVGYTEVYDRGARRTYDFEPGVVDPEFRGRQVDDLLVVWARRRVESFLPLAPEGKQVTLQTTLPVPGAEDTQLLLDRHEFEIVRSFLRMEVSVNQVWIAPEEPVWPRGVRVRTLRPDDRADARAFWEAQRESFRDHWGALPAADPEELFERFLHSMDGPEFDPELFWAAEDDEGVAGICFCWKTLNADPTASLLSHLGVLRRRRRQGIARALLRHAFRETRRRGFLRVGLGVDAQHGAGAGTLYEQEGMRVERTYYTHARTVREGDPS